MNITIKNQNNLPTIDYRTVKPLQGKLKSLSDENHAKLKSVLQKRGFEVPLFLWKHSGEFWLIDGHQRVHVMKKEDANDGGKYEVPYILIDAADASEAKQKLLEISSQYGTITYDGFDEFAADLPKADLPDLINFDALPRLDEPNFNPSDEGAGGQGKLDEKRKLTCPECGHEFTP